MADDFGVPASTSLAWYQPYDEWAEETDGEEAPELGSLPETVLPECGALTVGNLRAN